MLVCSFLSAIGTRDRGCSAHPAFPAPSPFDEGQRIWKARAKTCRENVFARHSGARRSRELWCAIAHLRIHNHRSSLLQRKPLTISLTHDRRRVWIPGSCGACHRAALSRGPVGTPRNDGDGRSETEYGHLVGAAGFEPTTCSTQNCRATRLRYTPIWLEN